MIKRCQVKTPTVLQTQSVPRRLGTRWHDVTWGELFCESDSAIALRLLSRTHLHSGVMTLTMYSTDARQLDCLLANSIDLFWQQNILLVGCPSKFCRAANNTISTYYNKLNFYTVYSSLGGGRASFSTIFIIL